MGDDLGYLFAAGAGVAVGQVAVSWRVIEGDCVQVMRGMAAASVDSVVCDPPYEFAFMSKSWDSTGVAFDPATWREALRVAKSGSYLIAFGGPRTWHRLVCAIEDAGWEIHDTLAWLFGTGFPKAKSCLKPAWEPVVLARKAGRTVAPLNIDGCRIPVSDSAYAANCSGDRGHADNRTRDIDFKMGCGHANGGGRWPANVVLDEEAAAMLDEQSGERRASGLYKPVDHGPNGNMRSTDFGGAGVPSTMYADSGGASRFYKVVAPDNPLFVCSAKTTIDEWNSEYAATADNPSSPQNQYVASALSDVAISVSLGEIRLSALKVLSTNVTPSALRRISDGVISLIQSIEPRCLPASFLISTAESSGNLAKPAEIQRLIDTTTITRSPTSFDGCVVVVTLISTSSNTALGGSASATRFRYVAKASRAERDEGLTDLPLRSVGTMEDDAYPWQGEIARGRKPRAATGHNTHPTVKPVALMRWLVRLVTPCGGVVLDPFLGSGSTGVAAIQEGFDFLGIEREPDYATIARKRIAHAAGDDLPLLAVPP